MLGANWNELLKPQSWPYLPVHRKTGPDTSDRLEPSLVFLLTSLPESPLPEWQNRGLGPLFGEFVVKLRFNSKSPDS